MEVRNITAELIRSGESLWSQVECEIRRDCVIVYARLCANEGHGVEGALAESERVFNSVLAGRDWLAAVHWTDRMCRTFKSRRSEHELPS
jgi:hypothetical protein